MVGGKLGIFSYASFSTRKIASGGWQVGDMVGPITPESVDLLKKWIPATLDSGEELDRYPSKEVRSRLLRRFAWLQVSLDGVSSAQAFYFSIPAGYDASGRPGNVFTVVALGLDGSLDIKPGKLMYSPQLPAPFGPKQVDLASIPTELTEPGIIDHTVLDYFLEGWQKENPLPEPWALVAPFNSGQPREVIVKYCVQLLRNRSQVVIACPPDESSLWVSAVLRAFSYTTSINFSTFETPETIRGVLSTGCELVVVSQSEAEKVADMLADFGVVVVDVSQAVPVAPAQLEDINLRPDSYPSDEPEQDLASIQWGESTHSILSDTTSKAADPFRGVDTRDKEDQSGSFDCEDFSEVPVASVEGLEDRGYSGSELKRSANNPFAMVPDEDHGPKPEEPVVEANVTTTEALRDSRLSSRSSTRGVVSAQVMYSVEDEWFFTSMDVVETLLKVDLSGKYRDTSGSRNISEHAKQAQWVIRLNQLLLVSPTLDTRFSRLQARVVFCLARGFSAENIVCGAELDAESIEEFQLVNDELKAIVNRKFLPIEIASFISSGEEKARQLPADLQRFVLRSLSQLRKNCEAQIVSQQRPDTRSSGRPTNRVLPRPRKGF